jgi:RNA recognition motif-containing protein
MKLLVRNLSRSTTEQEINTLFAEYGTVVNCSLVLDQETNKSKGFAFVEMESEDQANAALNALHETRIAKNRIRVKIAKKLTLYKTSVNMLSFRDKCYCTRN